jgi:hypothetical protein
MSAIQPPAFSPLFRAQTPPPPPSPARASRSDFFRAALDAVPGSTGAAPAIGSDRAEPLAVGFEGRSQRPGALLDIRV